MHKPNNNPNLCDTESRGVTAIVSSCRGNVVTDYFFDAGFFSCVLVRVFLQKRCALWQKENEEKEGGKNFAERQIACAPFVTEMLLLAFARHKEPMGSDNIHRRSRCLKLLQLGGR